MNRRKLIFATVALFASAVALPTTEVTAQEKEDQIRNVRAFSERGTDRSPAALAHLRDVALARGNVFEALLEAVKGASLGQVSTALYEVGGKYRRNM